MPPHIHPITAADRYLLRHTVLWPDKPTEYVQLPDDEQGFHYGTYLNDELVAAISLFINGNEARFRKFATRPDQQRKGLGTLLLQHVFAEARRLGATTICCDARLNAAVFYQQFVTV